MTPADGSIEEVIDILLVEPNPGDSRLFTENFKDAKLLNTIHTVEDGDAALEFVHQRGDYAAKPRPDIILLELQLPGKDGTDVLAELNDDPELREIPIVVLTSSAAGADIVRSHDLEADAFLQKPVGSDAFVEFVQSVEEFWVAIVREPDSETALE